jgi:hypothetical protein
MFCVNYCTSIFLFARIRELRTVNYLGLFLHWKFNCECGAAAEAERRYFDVAAVRLRHFFGDIKTEAGAISFHE